MVRTRNFSRRNHKRMGGMKVVIYPGHNSTVGLFGKETIVLQEEKFTNVKNQGGIPRCALEYLDLKDIDSFSVPMENMFSIFTGEVNPIEQASQGKLRRVWNWVEYKLGYKYPLVKRLMLWIRNTIYNKIVSPQSKRQFENEIKPPIKVKYFDHHTCHCYSPVYFYNLKDRYLLFSMDGAGDGSFAKIFIHSPYNDTTISNSGFDASLGLLYSEVTRYLGMKPNDHEHKVMGLAAYTNFDPIAYRKLKQLVWLNKVNLTFKSKLNLNICQQYLVENLKGIRFDHIAAAMQKLLEDYVVKWVETAIEKTNIKKIACSGGVFMNVKLNKLIVESEKVEKVYFMPSAGDESTIFGAHYLAGGRGSPQSMYLGLEYNNKEVKEFLKNYPYKTCLYDDIEFEIAELLASKKIVARFQGRGEFGARALGHRSILGNPSDIRTYYKINDMIKKRDFWMPFAPTILEERASDYIKNWDKLKDKVLESSRFMTVAFDSTPKAQRHFIAAMHPKDKTLRPQILNYKMDTGYHRLVKHFERRTGIGGVLNTSFNLHGYPLVGTLKQAMFTFENSGLKYMAIENFLISK